MCSMSIQHKKIKEDALCIICMRRVMRSREYTEAIISNFFDQSVPRSVGYGVLRSRHH